jgi:hypothetical protein
MLTIRNNKITVVAGDNSPTTDAPNAKEFEVFFNGRSVDYITANSKKFALSIAIERESSYVDLVNE